MKLVLFEDLIRLVTKKNKQNEIKLEMRRLTDEYNFNVIDCLDLPYKVLKVYDTDFDGITLTIKHKTSLTFDDVKEMDPDVKGKAVLYFVYTFEDIIVIPFEIDQIMTINENRTIYLEQGPI